MKKNAIFFLVDALRSDVFDDLDSARLLAPNMVSLIDRGFLCKATANAQSTQFVMPAVFSQTYPLDHGGYNSGIRDRPCSFVERLQEAGYATHLMASCNQLGSWHGYARGFDGQHATFDFRHITEYLIEKSLRYEVELWAKGERDEAEAIAIVQHELTQLLDGIELAIQDGGRYLWPPKLARINERVARGCEGERRLLQRDPRAVLRKLLTIKPIFYWRYLGSSRTGPAYVLWRLIESVRWRSRELLLRWKSPFFFLTHFETKANEIVEGVCRFVPQVRKPFYLHLHVMDVHDCCSISRFTVVLRWLRFLPRWLGLYLTGRTKRRFNYDLSVMFVDHQLGRLLDALRRAGRLEDTIILVTGDHGSAYAESPRRKGDVGERTHYEHLDVPLIVAGADRKPVDVVTIDSMGASATLLDALGVAPHDSFRGASAFAGGQAAVVSESAGRGNADLKRKDLYFTVTTPSHRMMTVLRGSELSVTRLYDRIEDPREINDLASDRTLAPVVDELLAFLHAERRDLLAARGALPPSSAVQSAAAG